MKPFLEAKNQLENAGELLDVNYPVEVYRNLHKQCWSVRQKGIVKYHTNYVFLRDVDFKVSQVGRERVVREKKKNVHAVVRGVLAKPTSMPLELDPKYKSVYYNPYKYSSFVDRDTETPIAHAEWADMMCDTPNPVIAWGIS